MRRLLLTLSLLSLAGCTGFKDLFTAHANAAATAGDQQLGAERLAALMTGGKGIQVNRETADFIGNVWIDYALFSQAVANRAILSDSSTAVAAMWPEIAELRGSHWHDTLVARRGKITPGTIENTYNGSVVRVFQHILFTVRPNSVPEEKAAARKKADAVLAQLKHGGEFGKLAQANSADPQSARDGGFLPPSPRGAFVAAFDSAGWALPPGGTTGLVETQFGYHIIRRPALDAVRDRVTAYVQQSTGAHFDSVYMDSLALRRGLKLVADAPKVMRAALQDPDGQYQSTKQISAFQGGGLTVAEFLRWVRALPPQYTAQLKGSDDAALSNFARVLSSNVLLLQQADSARIRLSPVEWQEMMQHYRAQIDTLRLEMGLDGAGVADSTSPKADRIKLAKLKVDDYFDRLIAGKARLRPLPATLGMVLRSKSTFSVNEAGLNRALELARAKQATDSTARGAAAPPVGGAMRPAPGPAPIPGGVPSPPPGPGTAPQK